MIENDRRTQAINHKDDNLIIQEVTKLCMLYRRWLNTQHVIDVLILNINNFTPLMASRKVTENVDVL